MYSMHAPQTQTCRLQRHSNKLMTTACYNTLLIAIYTEKRSTHAMIYFVIIDKLLPEYIFSLTKWIDLLSCPYLSIHLSCRSWIQKILFYVKQSFTFKYAVNSHTTVQKLNVAYKRFQT